MLLTFGIGALMYYVVFYQYRLVPRWLTVWGLVGITLTIISAVLVMFHLLPPFGTIQVILQSADPPAGTGFGGLADR